MQKKWICTSLILSAGWLPLMAEEQKGEWDLFTEFVYMRRADGKDNALILDSGEKEVDSGDLVNDFGFEPGFRVGLAYVPDVKSMYVANFLYVSEWEASKTKSAGGTLSFPFHESDFTEDFFGADEARAKYTSLFYTFDLNYWRDFSRREQDYFAISGIFGIRFAHVNEYCSLHFVDQSYGDYWASTQNNLIGIQGGGNFQINPTSRFSWNLGALVGIGLNQAQNHVSLQDQNDSVTVRKFRKETWQSVIFVDATTSFGYQVLPWANLHIGYEALYFSGLALAPAQLSHSTSDGRTHLATKGYIVVHGLFAGVRFNF